MIDLSKRHFLGLPDGGPTDVSSDQPKRIQIANHCLATLNIECRTCVETCEPMAIKIHLQIGKVGHPQIDPEACTQCGACLNVCPVSAMHLSTI